MKRDQICFYNWIFSLPVFLRDTKIYMQKYVIFIIRLPLLLYLLNKHPFCGIWAPKKEKVH